jgi:hypothetical protein
LVQGEGPPKEYQAFTSLVDKLLKVPKDEVLRREAEYKAEAAKSPKSADQSRRSNQRGSRRSRKNRTAPTANTIKTIITSRIPIFGTASFLRNQRFGFGPRSIEDS